MSDILDQLVAPQANQPAPETGDVLDQLMKPEPQSQPTAQPAPQGIAGFGQGLYDNTLGPLVNVGKQLTSSFTGALSPTDPQQEQARDTDKANALHEAGQHLRNGNFAAAAGALMSQLSTQDKGDPLTSLVSKLVDAHKLEAQKTIAAYKSGRYSEAAGHGLATVL